MKMTSWKLRVDYCFFQSALILDIVSKDQLRSFELGYSPVTRLLNQIRLLELDAAKCASAKGTDL